LLPQTSVCFSRTIGRSNTGTALAAMTQKTQILLTGCTNNILWISYYF